MAFFGDQRQRLLRESWTADALAQELFAMMGPDQPSNTSAPVSITVPDGSTVAPIQIGGTTDDTPVIQFKKPDGTDGGTISIIQGTLTFTPPGGGTPVPLGCPPAVEPPALTGGGGGGGGGTGGGGTFGGGTGEAGTFTGGGSPHGEGGGGAAGGGFGGGIGPL